MHKNTIIYVIVAAFGGFIIGFWLANSINRSALNLPGERQISRIAGDASTPSTTETDLTEAEINAKINESDNNSENFGFQKNLGLSLYRYAAMKQQTSLLAEAVRILERANALRARDFDVLVALGNAHFDIGFYKKDAASFQTAREIYSQALAVKPGDADVQTDLGLTYFLQEPPALDKAAFELIKVSDAHPKHERSMQFLVQTFVKQGKLADAERTLAKIKSLNLSNPAIADLTSEISAAQTGASK